MNPIIAIEGISFAGKTTLTKLLEKDGFARLYELAEKFEYGAGFPPFPKTTDEAKKSDLWFVEQEVKREQDARTKANIAPVVADRSFISGLAFGYSRQSVFRLGDVVYQHKIVRQVLDTEQLHIPWFVYLKIDINSFFERKRKDEERRIREYGIRAVNNLSVNEDERRFFEKQIEFYERIFSKVPHLALDALDAPCTLAEKVKKWSKELTTQFSVSNLEDLFVNIICVEE